MTGPLCFRAFTSYDNSNYIQFYMRMKQKLFSILALLLVAATSAWAQWTGGTHTATANENLNAINVSDDATLTINQGVTVTVNGGITVASGKTLTVTGGGTLVANGANGANGATGETGNAGGTAIAGNVIINGVGLTVTATGGQGGEGGGGGEGSDGDTGNPGGEGGTGGNGSTGGNGGSAFSGAVTIYAGSVTATGGQGGYGGTGGDGGHGGNGYDGGNGGKGGTGGTGGNGGNGGHAFAGTLTVFGGNVNAYGGGSGYGGSDGPCGPGGNGYDGGADGEDGEPGEMGEDGSDGVAYASNVTFQAATHTMTDGTDNITEATGKKTVIITSPDVLPAPPTYAITLAEGTEDADKWTISPNPAEAGSPVTATYSGDKKVKSVKAVKKAVDPLTVPMTIEAITAGTISVSDPKAGMQYSKNGGAKTAVTTSIDVAAGDKVQFYGNGTSITSYGASPSTIITGSGDGFTCKVYGNIMSLVDEENFATATTLSADYTFRALFNGNTTLTDASGLLLPATQLASSCYYAMFMGCTALTTAPELPATQLAASSYYYMFRGCTALTAAPELPATTLANSCYYSMFYNCYALTAAPALPATQLAESCYNQMFRGCTALTTAPALPAMQLVSSCYRSMFMGCTVLTTAPVLPATQLAPSCYYQMFINCSKLATVTCLATSGIGTNSTTDWLTGAGTDAEDTKTVYTSSSASWPMNNNNGIPTGWERVNVDN